MSSQLDANQVIANVHDEVNDALQVNVVAVGPGGLATSANQTNGDQKTQIVDGSGNVVGSTGNALDVNIKSGVTLEVNLDQANDEVAVYGNDGTTNRILKTDAAGELQVDVLSSALPTGAATEATLSSLDGKVTTVDTDDVTITSSALPTGASTEATLASIDTKVATETTLSAINTKTPALVSGRVPVDGSGVTQPISAASLPLPTGAATEATLSTLNGKVTAVDTGNVTVSVEPATSSDGSAGLPVLVKVIAGYDGTNVQAIKTDSNGELQVDVLSSPAQSGRSVVTTHRRDYSSSSVTTAAWAQLIASLGANVNEIEIFDSSGETLELGTGAAAAETRLVYVIPGGNGRIPVSIASGTRLSIKAVSADATVGELVINLYS